MHDKGAGGTGAAFPCAVSAVFPFLFAVEGRLQIFFTASVELLEDGARCSAVYLLFPEPGSIHINVALSHAVIYAVFITPETCTRACKVIKC